MKGSRVPKVYAEHWAELYKQGQTVRAIAERYGRPYGTVHYHLKKAGVQFRNRSHYRWDNQ